jgi:DNA-directed RNA polymerase subunit H
MSHQLVPKHEVISEKEVEDVLNRFELTKDQLPKILITDPVVKRIGAKVGDVIKITRESPTAGISEFYRMVIDIV